VALTFVVELFRGSPIADYWFRSFLTFRLLLLRYPLFPSRPRLTPSSLLPQNRNPNPITTPLSRERPALEMGNPHLNYQTSDYLDHHHRSLGYLTTC
jgi:hypothetical protein